MTVDKFTVRLVRNGDKYGRDFCLTHDRYEPLVEFYDTHYMHTEFGQFVNRYYASTLLERDTGGLCLDGGVPAWAVSAEDMATVRAWIKQQIFERKTMPKPPSAVQIEIRYAKGVPYLTYTYWLNDLVKVSTHEFEKIHESHKKHALASIEALAKSTGMDVDPSNDLDAAPWVADILIDF